MSNSDSIREQLTYKAGLQIFLTIGAVIFTTMFTLPRIEESNARVEEANIALEKFQTMFDSGINYENLISSIQSIGNNAELVEIIQRSWENVKTILAKTGSKPYLEWLKNNSINNEEDQIKLADAQAKINSIIPTLNPINHNRNNESVSLREYISFVEQNLLSQFNIESLSPLGIDGVKYKEDENGTLENPVGELSVEIQFKTINKNIISLLDFIQKSGEPSVLAKDEILSNPPTIMSNPLITVESLALTKMLDPGKPNEENSGRLVIKFYVRGSSMTDINYLTEAFNKRKAALGSDISSKLESCEKESCVALDAYKSVYKKFQQLDTSLSAILTKNSNPVEKTYILGQQLQSLQSIRTEFENIK